MHDPADTFEINRDENFHERVSMNAMAEIRFNYNRSRPGSQALTTTERLTGILSLCLLYGVYGVGTSLVSSLVRIIAARGLAWRVARVKTGNSWPDPIYLYRFRMAGMIRSLTADPPRRTGRLLRIDSE